MGWIKVFHACFFGIFLVFAFFKERFGPGVMLMGWLEGVDIQRSMSDEMR